MGKGIYLASDGSLMSEEDLITWIKYEKCKSENLGLNFDDITGGVSEFVDAKDYKRIKETFNMIR